MVSSTVEGYSCTLLSVYWLRLVKIQFKLLWYSLLNLLVSYNGGTLAEAATAIRPIHAIMERQTSRWFSVLKHTMPCWTELYYLVEMQLVSGQVPKTETEKQSNSSTISFPPGAKPCPKQQLARWVGPYLRRAAGGEALIGDWGGWRLSGW